MKRFALVILVTFMGIASLAYAGPEHPEHQQQEFRAWRLIDDGALLIDVRSQQEFKAGHLEEAINIPHDKVEKMAEKIGDDKDREVVVYCRSGGRAEYARKALQEKGYNNVHNGLGYRSGSP